MEQEMDLNGYNDILMSGHLLEQPGNSMISKFFFYGTVQNNLLVCVRQS